MLENFDEGERDDKERGERGELGKYGHTKPLSQEKRAGFEKQ
jgi:hypothetical protein